jgi:hypothetical protein
MRAQYPEMMKAGRHYFDGACAPWPGHKGWWEHKTISVGIFKAVLTAKGDKCKRGPVLYRVKGRLAQADQVFARATEICQRMNIEQWYETKKSEVVR